MKKVFDAYASYYDQLYKDKDYEKEAKYILNLLSNHSIFSGSILDLGCGTGIHAQFMAQKGFMVHGVDISPEMVEIASNKNYGDYSKQLFFELGDVKSCQLDKTFDAVVSLFHVASYQTSNEDLSLMFLTASKHLNPEGIFIFDFWYGPAVLMDNPVVRVKRFNGDGVNILRIAEPNMRVNENIVDVNYNIMVTKEPEEEMEVLLEKHSMRYFFLPELLNALNLAGMEYIDSHSWLSSDPLSEKSWQGLIIAKKTIIQKNENSHSS